jgi:hypothetical protein
MHGTGERSPSTHSSSVSRSSLGLSCMYATPCNTHQIGRNIISTRPEDRRENKDGDAENSTSQSRHVYNGDSDGALRFHNSQVRVAQSTSSLNSNR